MVSLTEIVLRLREQCSGFSNRVAGTLEFGEAMQSATADLVLPFCFVIPLEELNVGALIPDDQVTQTVRSYFATIVAVDNSVNRGKAGGSVARLAPFDEVVMLKEQLQTALMHWRPVQRMEPARYYRSQSMGMDNKRLWHQFEWFVVEEYVDRQNSDSVENAIAQIVNDTTEATIAFNDSFVNRLRTIYLNYGLNAEAEALPLSLDDYWLTRAMAASGADNATDDAIEAKRLSALAIAVPDDLPPTPPPDPEDIGEVASHAPPPTETPKDHRRNVEEP